MFLCYWKLPPSQATRVSAGMSRNPLPQGVGRTSGLTAYHPTPNFIQRGSFHATVSNFRRSSLEGPDSGARVRDPSFQPPETLEASAQLG